MLTMHIVCVSQENEFVIFVKRKLLINTNFFSIDSRRVFTTLLIVPFSSTSFSGRDVACVTRGRWTEVRMAPGDGEAPAVGTRRGSMRIPDPVFSDNNFRSYMDDIELWREECELAKAKQGILLWLSLPRDTPSDIKESISASLGMDKLKKDTDIDNLSPP